MKDSHKSVIVSLLKTNNDRKEVQIPHGKSNTRHEVSAIPNVLRAEIWRMYEEQSADSSKGFLLKLIRKAPFPIRMIQTDNGIEFTNALLVVKAKHKSAFEAALEELGMEYHRIRIATPRHNGKVERQHRIDVERFYSQMANVQLGGWKKAVGEVSADAKQEYETLSRHENSKPDG